MSLRLRFAPSPTGYLHIGSARTALYNFLLARASGGTFILRIEDTDRSRSTEQAIQAIMEDLRWLGLDWDEGPDVGGPCGPYRQTERMDIYRQRAEQLLESGSAYRCYCEPGDECRCRERPAGSGPYAVRFRVPEGKTAFDDAIMGRISFENSSIEDFVLLRRDGTATYHLAVVADDIAMGITHVIRGSDHISNTPKQILVYHALGAEPPVFAHMPLTVGPDGKPLSKRHGDVALSSYRELGFLPEAMLNYFALLGWSLDDTTTIIDLKTLIENFSLERVSRNPGTWDLDKLTWMNGQYIMRLEWDDLAARLTPFMVGAGLIEEGDEEALRLLRRAVPLIRERIKLLGEAPALTAFLFREVSPEPNSLDLIAGEGARRILEEAEKRLRDLEPFVAPAIEETLRRAASDCGLKPREAFQPIRLAVTGSRVSPPLFESMELVGRERCLQRLERARRLSEEIAG